MILLAGATGYVGRYLSIYLKERGYDVLALGRSKKVEEFFKENDVPFQTFDITNQEDYKKLPTENVQAIINLAGVIAEHETPVNKFFEINTLGTYNILEFARINGIKKVIMSSTHKVYNDLAKTEDIKETDGMSYTGDHTPYIISKIAAENFMEYYNKDFGLNTITLRFTGVHGYGEILGFLAKDGTYKKSTFEIFVEKALNGEDIEVWGNSKIKRDHIYIKDVLRAIECAVNAESAHGIYNLASGVGYSLYEEAKYIAKVFASEKGQSKVSKDETKQGLKRGYIYNIDKIKSELNWKPQYANYEAMLIDYKEEWKTKKFKNYHDIREDQRPVTF